MSAFDGCGVEVDIEGPGEVQVSVVAGNTGLERFLLPLLLT